MKGYNLRASPSPSIILARDFNGTGNATHERAWPHGAANRDTPTNVCKIEKSIAELDAGHVVTNENGTFREFGNTHSTPSPSLNTSEQLGVFPEALPLINLHNRTDLAFSTNDRSPAPSGSTNVNPLNDNWHPDDAA